jgi:acyl carrier protein
MTNDTRPGPEAADIEHRILTFLQRELLEPGTPIDRAADLLSGEVIDSIGVLRLAAFVGEEFHLVVQPSDFVVENFRNVTMIAGYIGRTLAAQRARDVEP